LGVTHFSGVTEGNWTHTGNISPYRPICAIISNSSDSRLSATDHLHHPDIAKMSDTTSKVPSEFEKAAAEVEGESLLNEFWSFLAHNKKWWMLPIVIVMLLLGTLMVLSSTAVTPFIYTLF
jgi:hypothetical protein